MELWITPNKCSINVTMVRTTTVMMVDCLKISVNSLTTIFSRGRHT